MRLNVIKAVGAVHGVAVHSRRARVLADWFVKTIPIGHRVLDFGCGDGLIDHLILQKRPDLEIRGVDVFVRSDSLIPVEVFDGKRLPFADQSFDTVIACDVLHHSESPIQSLREIVRVAAKNVILKDHFVKGFLARPVLRFMDFVGNAPHGVVLPYNYLTPQEWHQGFDECGLSVQELITDVRLYPAWADWVFGRSLHFVTLLSRHNQDGSSIAASAA